MRVLLVMIEPPMPFGNAAARWFYVLLRGLVSRGHDVTAFASCSNSDDIPRAEELFPSPQYDLRCYPVRSGASLMNKVRSFLQPMSYLLSEALRADVARELAAGYSVLHLEPLWGAWLAPRLPERTIANVHYLFDIDQREQWQDHGRSIDRRILQAERALLRRLANIAALTPRLAARIREINPAAQVVTMPLGIDLSLYPFRQEVRHDRPTVGLIGSFNWGPTRAAGVRLVRDLWPKIKERISNAKLMLVGRGLREAFCASHGEHVVLYPDVADSLRYFNEIDVLLYAPPVGSGMKIKVMEALATGTAVVTNSDGAEGLPLVDGIHAGISQSDDGLIERTVELLADGARRARYALAGRQLLEVHCSPTPVLDNVEAIYRRIIGSCVHFAN